MKDKKVIDPDFPDFDEVINKNKKPAETRKEIHEDHLAISETSRAELETQLNLMEAKEQALTAKLQEQKEAYVRLQAEMENFRRRMDRDMQDKTKYATKTIITDLLPVADNLARSLEHKSGDINSLHTGVELTQKLLQGAMEKAGVKEVNPIDQMFDPNLHEAMSTQPSDKPAGTVLTVLQKGYLLHDRLLRPAMVIVAKEG